MVVPHLDGERTPNRPDATGTITGLRSNVDRPLLARAAFEGVVANLLAGAESLGVTEGRVVLVGGGARSAAFRQVVADLVGRPVTVPTTDELVARGAAVQAAAVLTGAGFDEISAAWGLDAGTTTDPDPTADGTAIRQAFGEAAGP